MLCDTFFLQYFVELGHIGVVELAGSQAVNGQWAITSKSSNPLSS